MSFSEEQWRDFIKILMGFGYEIKNGENNRKNIYFLWELIVNIKENMKSNIEQDIRVNMELCYLLEEEEQIKGINSPLFKINHLFEQNIYRFDYEPSKGLSDFYKLIITTYGNIENFLEELKQVKENLSFVRKRYDQELIKKYNYLKKISLPLKSYEELRMALLTILKKFTELRHIISNPQDFKVLIGEIDNFINRYRIQYNKEHLKFHQELNNFYQELYLLPEYHALDCLSNIKVINVAYNMRPIKKYINTFFPEKCRIKNLDEVLEKKTKCNCGFNLGETLSIPSLDKIKPMLRKGISEYMEQLQNKRFRSLFDNYLSYHNDSKIGQLLAISPDRLNGNLKILDKNIIKEINKALNNTYPLKITLDEIGDYIIGTYPFHNLQILGKDLEKALENIIKTKLAGLDEVNFDQIVINLIK